MIQKIEKQIEKQLRNIIIYSDYNDLLNRIYIKTTNILKYYKRNMSIYDFIVTCDKTNNIDNKHINCRIYLQENNSFTIKVLEFNAKILDCIKSNRKNKLEKINIINNLKTQHEN